MGAARQRGRHRKARVASQQQVAVRDGGRHLERRVGRQPDRSRRGGTAVGSVRPGVTAAVALVGASVIAVTPVAPPPPPEIHVASAEVRLAAESSILNIPINLIQDIIDIPYNYVQGINTLGQSLLFTGTWLLASSTNVWGTDPGDPGHHYGLAIYSRFRRFPTPWPRRSLGWRRSYCRSTQAATTSTARTRPRSSRDTFSRLGFGRC